jgi:hypothetical protein
MQFIGEVSSCRLIPKSSDDDMLSCLMKDCSRSTATNWLRLRCNGTTTSWRGEDRSRNPKPVQKSTYALGGLRLMVPVSVVDEVREILESTLPDEEPSLAEAETQAGSTREEEFSMIRSVDPNGRGRRLLLWSALFFFGAPDPNYLRLFYF